MEISQLYDSDTYVVVQIDANSVPPGRGRKTTPRHGFEIVGKKLDKFVYLDGAFAECFSKHIRRWQAHSPNQSEVERVLDSYATLMVLPLVIH